MANDPGVKTEFATQLFEECRGMAVYAAERGKTLQVGAAECIDAFERWSADPDKCTRPDLAVLVNTHNSLSQLVAPAKPQAILLIGRRLQKGKLNVLMLVPLVKNMIIVTVVSLLAFIGSVLSPHINQDDINVFSSADLPLLVQLGFLISASALGASFGALYKVNKYIRELTYDPKQASSYWIRFLLGIISGLILSLIVETKAIQSTLFEANVIRPLLAIVGGFSAELFYTLLNRMVETVKSLFEGSSKEILDNRVKTLNLKAAQKDIETKTAIAQKIVGLKNISQNLNSKKMEKAIDKILKDLFPGTDLASSGDKDTVTNE